MANNLTILEALNKTVLATKSYVDGKLADKVDKEAGKGLSTNDLTDLLKSNYDAAYTHSQTTHAPSNAQKNSDITKAEIEAKLTGQITSHTHAETYTLPAATSSILGGIKVGKGLNVTADGTLSATTSEESTHTHSNMEVLDGISAERVAIWDAKSDFNGDYNSLTNKPTIPTKTSELENDADFATKQYVDNSAVDIEAVKAHVNDIDAFATFEVLEGYTYTTSGDYKYCYDVDIPFTYFEDWTVDEDNYFYSDYKYSYTPAKVVFTFSDGTTKEAPMVPYGRGYQQLNVPAFMVDYDNCTDSEINSFYIELFGRGSGAPIRNCVALLSVPANCTSIKITTPIMLASRKYVADAIAGVSGESGVDEDILNSNLTDLFGFVTVN